MELSNILHHPSLNTLIQYGIIDPDSVLNKTMKIKEMLESHPYAITPPTTEKGRWQTFYKDSNGNRKNIKAPTKEELIKKLIQIYSANSHVDNLTFYSLYTDWLEYKKTVSNSQNTIKRHEQHYKKYFLNSKLHDMLVKSIDEITLEQICNSLVKEHNLSRKEWGNIKTILKGMFDYAYRKKYITTNSVSNISISVKFRQIVRKTGKSQTYNTDELKALNDYLDKMYTETVDSSFLAVKLNFLLGLRVGELVALKWSDIEDSQLHIIREEIRNQQSNHYEIVEHTKTNTDRFVILIPKALNILDLLPHDSEFIFTRNGELLHTRQIAYVLEKYAERNGLSTKSTHKLRKTYASNLSSKNVPLDAIRELLGHSNLQTTLSYIYNPLTEQETVDLIKNAL